MNYLPLVFGTRLRGLWCALCWLGVYGIGLAQDMRVYTTVSTIENDPRRSQVVSHSLTLFHAGKVYDYMEDIGELVVLDTSRNRFMVLGGNYSATEISFAEVHQFLESAKAKADEYLAEASQKGDENQVRRAQALAFQLEPALRTEFLETTSQLNLTGEFLSYQVETAPAESPAFLSQYLSYADWAARLNYVLHPHAAYPTARLKLDEELQKQGRLPVVVELSASLDHPVRLRAKHEYRALQAIDRQLINRWEQQLGSEQTRWVTFHEYQQRLVAAQNR